jgi:hypothetical protein
VQGHQRSTPLHPARQLVSQGQRQLHPRQHQGRCSGGERVAQTIAEDILDHREAFDGE